MKISNIKKINYSKEVYNLHIEDNHNYFANDICVSNCHTFNGAQVRSVGENAVNAQYRIGFTGTLPEDFKKAEKMLIYSVLGPISDVVLTDQLIKEKSISDLVIHIPFLNYSKEICSKVKKDQKNLEGIDAERVEKKFIFEYDKRNEFIVNITKKIIEKNENVLILVNKKAHLEKIVEKLTSSGIIPYIVCGDTELDERNKVRHNIENEGGKVIIATEGVYSTGISINRLHAIIFAAAGKSKIRTLQSVGRGLRMHETKTKLKLFDIADNLEYSIKHLQPRMEFYAKNNFNVKTVEIDI